MVAITAVLTTHPDFAQAQLSVSNLLEVQNGNRPFNPFDPQPKNRIDVYDQLHLSYAYGASRVGLRFESDESSEDQNAYREITQRWAEWSDDHLRARVGNFETILGRGLIHRSFELPGVVLDDPAVRSRFAPTRDVDGALLEATAGPAALRLLGGSPNVGDVSPAREEAFGQERYAGRIFGGQATLSPRPATMVGAAYLRTSDSFGGGAAIEHELASGFVELDPLGLAGVPGLALPLYVEYARQDAPASEWFELSRGEDVPHALYGGANLLWGAFALSAEWKDYRDFRLGINDPPSLVREHSWALLNRNTHVLNATDEEGFQLEGSWTWSGRGTATVNRSRADGVFGLASRRFEETFAELHAEPFGAWRWEPVAFYDFGEDGFQFVEDRDLFGASLAVTPRPGWTVTGEYQKQYATRAGEDFDDQLVTATIARAGWGSASLIVERSTDPAQEESEEAAEPGIHPRHWVGGLLQARIGERHQATLFAGERRGGPACTAGTCYEVQPFVGAELRLVSNF